MSQRRFDVCFRGNTGRKSDVSDRLFLANIGSKSGERRLHPCRVESGDTGPGHVLNFGGLGRLVANGVLPQILRYTGNRRLILDEYQVINQLAESIDPTLMPRSGRVFYSGRRAFSQRSDLYLIGINPGGDPIAQSGETIDLHTSDVLNHLPARWSAYSDESWRQKPPGTHGLQPRVLHMLEQLRRDPQETPSSNLIFVRSAREESLGDEKNSLVDLCWPFHRKVIELLRPRVLVCFGKSTGRNVMKRLGANVFVDSFVERNNRGWTSDAHATSEGTIIVTVTHPGIADWKKPDTDPTPLVRAMLNTTQSRSG